MRIVAAQNKLLQYVISGYSHQNKWSQNKIFTLVSLSRLVVGLLEILGSLWFSVYLFRGDWDVRQMYGWGEKLSQELQG